MQIDKLKTDNERLTQQIEDLEAYSRRNNVIIHGIPATNYADIAMSAQQDGTLDSAQTSESTTTAVLDLFNNKLGVQVEPHQISVAHRLSRGPAGSGRVAATTPPPVIVTFVARNVRDRVFNARKKLKNLREKIFINEHLSSAANELCRTGRQLIRDKKLEAIWSYNGRVYAKKSANGERFVVRQRADLPT